MIASAAKKETPRFLRIEEVSKLVGLGRTAIYTTEGFPVPVKLTKRASGWVEDEVLAWMRQKCEARKERTEHSQ